MNHIKVLLKSTGRSEYFLFQDDKCVTAMNSIPPGEIMGRVHIADQSDKAPATKGVDAWKGYPANQFQGFNHVPNISTILATLSTMLSKTRTEIFTSYIRVLRPWGCRRSFSVLIFRRLLPVPHHATLSIASLLTASPSYIWNLRLLSVTLTISSRTSLSECQSTSDEIPWSRPVPARGSGSQDPSVSQPPALILQAQVL
jgi:hypothetical protein